MKAKIGIDTNEGLVEFEMEGKIGYEPMKVFVNAPSNSGGGVKYIEIMRVWEGTRTLLVPFDHLAYIEMTGEE
jgi:hypothetical protein